jgi:cell wall-associated NlpC family hydrolase
MNYLCTIVSVAPLRKEPSHTSEMISQLLFGECAIITDATKDFYKIQSLFDNYEGWCSKKQVQTVDENFCQQNHQNSTTQPITKVMHNHYEMLLSSGSFIGAVKNNIVEIENLKFTFQENDAQQKITDIKSVLFSYINTPYLWGGKSIFGIDCSGFTQQVYKILGHPLYRDAYQQATQGSLIGFLQEAKMGDLAFFDNEENKITHVGILLNEAQIIHASGSVRVDTIDNAGIIHATTNERTHRLRLIKRILS